MRLTHPDRARMPSPAPMRTVGFRTTGRDRYQPRDAGAVISPGPDETALHGAARTLALAAHYGMEVPARLLVFATGRRAIDTIGQRHELHAPLPQVLRHLDTHAAPDGYGFAFERGELILRRRGPYLTAADAGIVHRAPDGPYGGDWVGLRILALAHWCGMRMPVRWLRMGWRAEFDDTLWSTTSRAGFDALDDAVDDALAWLDVHHDVPGHTLVVDEDDNLLLTAR